eukprot:676779_1
MAGPRTRLNLDSAYARRAGRVLFDPSLFIHAKTRSLLITLPLVTTEVQVYLNDSQPVLLKLGLNDAIHTVLSSAALSSQLPGITLQNQHSYAVFASLENGKFQHLSAEKKFTEFGDRLSNPIVLKLLKKVREHTPPEEVYHTCLPQCQHIVHSSRDSM